jgi:hypothetical protein
MDLHGAVIGVQRKITSILKRNNKKIAHEK